MTKNNTLELEENPTPDSESEAFENVDESAAKRKNDHEIKKAELDLGKIGKYIGGNKEKAGNIACTVIILAFLILIGAAVAMVYTDNPKFADVLSKIVTGSFSLISGALGFIFGSSVNSN